MKRFLLYTFLLFAFNLSAQDAQRAFEHNFFAGLNIGASAPLSLPATIREINAYVPGFNPSLGYECVYYLKGKWRAGAGVKLDYKGMTVKDRVMYMRTKITVESGSSTGGFEGYFTGDNETEVHNAYLSFPVNMIYDFNSRWRMKLGGYAAWLIKSGFSGNVSNGYMRNETPVGEKIIIDHASFDLGKEQNTWDFGVNAACERSIGKNFGVAAGLMWGLRPLFSSANSSMDFKMYNVYGTLGAIYKIR
jgi:hypothetical protein